jgi:LacI family transcriptional regulator
MWLARHSITIDDVAREARVAKSTVSRALNNPGRLAPRTQDHVREVARRMGYRPNAAARALGTKRTETIALAVPSLTSPFVYGIIRGAEHEASAAGKHLLLVDVEEDSEREADQIRRLVGSVDGVVLEASRLRSGRIRQLGSAVPMVVINRSIGGLPSVLVDPTSGPASAVEHLVSLGHRHVVYVSGPRTSWINRRRWSSISAAAARHKITATLIGPFAAALESGQAAADTVIAQGATAVIAFNDLIAIGMVRRFAKRRVAVPGEVSVVGFDDIFGADFCSPPLTTLAAPLDDLGRIAVRILLGARPSDSARRIVLPAPLVVRGSTGPAPD